MTEALKYKVMALREQARQLAERASDILSEMDRPSQAGPSGRTTRKPERKSLIRSRIFKTKKPTSAN